MSNLRIEQSFTRAKQEKRPALVTFTMAYDPSAKDCITMLEKLPDAGADIIELGMPFSDPVADGPVIQQAAMRAIAQEANLKGILELVKEFRKLNSTTPVVLMGYVNPILHYGLELFIADAAQAGVDGLIIVDVPPEEGQELFSLCCKHKIDFIRLITPTTDEVRIKLIAENARGFVYYVSVAGITGAKVGAKNSIEKSVATIKKHTHLPVVVGFGIKNAELAKTFGQCSDGVVVGSALVECLHDKGTDVAIDFVRSLAKGMVNVD